MGSEQAADNRTWATLVLNPRWSGGVVNPLCPNCEQPIKSRSNEDERRFVCGCDELQQFRFMEESDE